MTISKIEIETKSGKTIELNLDEAKDLYNELHGLFGNKAAFIPTAPIVIEKYRDYPWWNRPHVTYLTDTKTNSISCSSNTLKATYSVDR